ncbi:MAG: hypothetical protein GXO84_09515 [Chlorobi bacterium]|nr:hypothetical protein [Chlorobiota bacterium]
MTDNENNTGELVTDDDASIDLNALIPLGVQLIENSNKQSHAQLKHQQDVLDFNKEKLKVHKSAFKHKYWLIAFITAAIIGISVGLIFGKDDTVSGMAILTHVGAVIVGIIAGSGWQNINAK